eukprot:15355128-Ditylum_brightwellii.AAC.1
MHGPDVVALVKAVQESCSNGCRGMKRLRIETVDGCAGTGLMKVVARNCAAMNWSKWIKICRYRIRRRKSTNSRHVTERRDNEICDNQQEHLLEECCGRNCQGCIWVRRWLGLSCVWKHGRMSTKDSMDRPLSGFFYLLKICGGCGRISSGCFVHIRGSCQSGEYKMKQYHEVELVEQLIVE